MDHPESTQSDSAGFENAPHIFEHTYHDVHLTETPVRALVWEVINEYLAPFIPPAGHVLELGAGYCYWINGVQAARRVAIDLWEDMAAHAAPRVETLQHDLTRGLAFLENQTFDTVLASNVFEHFELDVVERLVHDVYKRLKFGGRLLVIQPNYRYAYRHYFDDYTHRSIFSDVSLSALLRAQNFRIERVEPRFTPYSLRGSRLPVRKWLIRLYLHSPIRPWAGQMLVVAQKSIH
jgi:SAM-dependent methyltransferase